MTDAQADVFTPDVVAAILRHMNHDHGSDAAVICRGLGGVADVTAALTTAVDADGIEFAAQTLAGPRTVRIAWRTPILERPQVRSEVVWMYHESCRRLGIEPRTAE